MEEYFLSNSRLRKGEVPCDSAKISELLILALGLQREERVEECGSVARNKIDETGFNLSQQNIPLPFRIGGLDPALRIMNDLPLYIIYSVNIIQS